MSYKLKIIVGFRRDQEHTIDAEEAHKAYYLFLNPEQRGVFNNGLGICGSQIQEIVPDYNATMGWNPNYSLDSDDWNEIRRKKVDVGIRDTLYLAKTIAKGGNPSELDLPLSVVRSQYQLENTQKYLPE